jgi:hypothetical protein
MVENGSSSPTGRSSRHDLLDGGTARERRRRHSAARRRLHRALLVGFVAASSATATAGAVTGALDVGSVIQGGKPTGPPENRQAVDEVVLAQGMAPVAGPWQIRSFTSEETRYQGEVIEPAGLECIRLVLSDPPPGSPLVGSGFCGEAGNRGFDITDVPVRDRSGQVVVLLFGRVPEDATRVELTTGGDERTTVEPLEGPRNVTGDLWQITTPPNVTNPRVRWFSGHDIVGGTLDAAPHLQAGKRLASTDQHSG